MLDCETWTDCNVPALVRLRLDVALQAVFRLEPLGALDAVVLSEAGQVLGVLELLELLQVLGGLEVGLDLVEVARLAPRLGDCALRKDTHCGCLFGSGLLVLDVLGSVWRWFATGNE